MKTIKVKFVDFYRTSNPKKDFIARTLLKYYNVEFSDQPDYLFFSTFGDEHLKYNDCVKIFFTGECYFPDFNLCDYAIGFEYMDLGDRFFRLPIYYPMQCAKKAKLDNVRNNFSNDLLKDKKGFCSFVYSNAGADSVRDEIFDKLSEYKRVDSGGRYRNNIGGSVDDKISFQSQYKFCIAFENTSYPGYTTEKLLHAFESGSIPIYWGDPLIGKVFNTESFINSLDFPTIDDVVKRVIEIDNDDIKYMEMIKKQPILNHNDYFDEKFVEFDKWLCHIIDQPVEKAKRYSRGYWNQVYLSHIIQEKKAFKSTPKEFVKSVIKPIYYKIKKL